MKNIYELLLALFENWENKTPMKELDGMTITKKNKLQI